MKHDWKWWLETIFLIDTLRIAIPVVVMMALAIWLVWRAFGSW